MTSKSSKGNKEVKEGVKEENTEIKWAFEEDMMLPDLVLKLGIKNWDTIAKELAAVFAHVVSYIPKTALMCESRWKKLLQNGKKRGHWSTQEDQLILQGIQKQKEALGCSIPLPCDRIQWQEVAEAFYGLRSSKQCRERYANHLCPDLKRTPWTTEEDMILIHYQKLFGNSWTKISKEIHGRSENEVKNRWYSVILKRYSQESLDSMHINIDKLTYGTQSDVTPPSPPLPSENSGSSANVSNVTVPIQDPSEPSNLIQDLTTGDNKNDKFSCTPEASGHKRMRKRPSRYEADLLIGNGKDDQAEFAEIGLDSDEDTYESKRRRCKKAKSTVNPTLPRNQSYQTLTEDVLTSDSEWNECIDLSRQKQSSKSNHSKKYQYQYSDDRSAASFSSFFPRYPDHMNPLPPHVQSMYHRLPTSELEQVFVKMIEKTEHIIDAGKRILEGDFSRVFILTDNKPLDDRDIQAVIELADIYLENILFPNGDISSLMMTADDEDLNNPLLDLGLSKQTTPDESHHSPGFIHHHIESSNSSISTTQHLDKYFDAMFDSTEEDSSLQQLHADSNSSFSKPEIQQKQNAVAIGGLPMELVQGSHLPLEAEHNNSVEVSQNKVLSLKKPSDDELSAASLLSTRFQEPASSSSVSSLSGNYDAGQMKTEDDETAKDSPTSRSAAIPILNPNPNSSSTCNFDIDPHSQMIPKQNFSGNTTTLSTSSSPSLSFLQNEWAFSNSTSPIWMEYATCMLRSAPASPNSNIKNGILRKCA